MGYDAFGLPAEQYAIEHGIHPKESTDNNIENFRKQLNNIGFSFDWDREVRTSDVKFYKWTQWIFLQLFNSYFCHTDKRHCPYLNLLPSMKQGGLCQRMEKQYRANIFQQRNGKRFQKKRKRIF
jgi:leucyl-tRNA synthetase